MARTKREDTDKPAQAASTPLMAQYFSVKAKHPDAVLLFRVGDFYETFGEDAIKASRALGITLTNRNNGGSDVELAGFPHHALDIYLPRLVRNGFRVAICEQMEKPTPGKVVKRSVTEVVTPGVTTDDALLDNQSNNFLAALAYCKNDQVGIAFLDISTGEFFISEGDQLTIDKLFQSFRPSEVLLPKGKLKDFTAAYGDKVYSYTMEDWIFAFNFGREKLLQHFRTPTLKGFGVEELELGQAAAGAVLQYLAVTENTKLGHIASISRLHTERYVWLDRFTIRNLELVQASNEQGASLLRVLDRTSSPMGARLLKKWLLLPLTNLTQIRDRQEVVAFWVNDREKSDEVQPHIRQVGDLERLIGKAALGKLNPREAMQLRRALLAVADLKTKLEGYAHAPAALKKLAEVLNPCPSLRARIERDLAPDPPVDVRKGGTIADGADAELDELRATIRDSRDMLAALQQRESDRSGIPSLKIGFNSVFGYYLEVSNKYKNQAPADWMRKQTIANGERYVTEELKLLEARILGAEDKILETEERLFRALVEEIATYVQPIQLDAQLLARLDCLLSFAALAVQYNYCQPELDEHSFALEIREGRHPVIETQLPPGELFVPNDVLLDHENTQIMLITGPNMAGKSALLRQTALIVLMAQMGSFVPAASVKMGLVDKVFTRVGASDNISGGESTFMVEMNETALIMNNITHRSLVLLDEIGRGTSTYDGISIAWSLTEFLHDNEKARPKTLFATHYHELNELAERHERIKNFHIATKQVGKQVIFLRKLTPGGSNHSFGIHVARLAGMPAAVVERAEEILKQLESQTVEGPMQETELVGLENDTNIPKVDVRLKQKVKETSAPMQLQIFESLDPFTVKLKEELLALDLNTMTPMDALWKLNELRRLAEKK